MTLRVTVIAGEQCADDFAVIWRGMSIGRIKQATGTPHGASQWTWSCHVHGRPQGSDERGSGADLDDAKAQFKDAWARIRAGLTDQDIADEVGPITTLLIRDFQRSVGGVRNPWGRRRCPAGGLTT